MSKHCYDKWWLRKDILSSELVKILPLELMLEHYYLGHEMSKEDYFEHIKHVFDE